MPKIIKKYSIFSLKNRRQGNFLLPILDQCVAAIDALGAWPVVPNTPNVPYEIHVLERGQLLQKNDDSAHNPNDTSYKPIKLRLEISLDYFESAPAQHLLAANLTHDQILTQSLGHEIFHMDEIARGSDCGLEFKLRRSGFAKSIRPSMNPEWRELIKATALAFISHHRPKTHWESSLSLDDHALRAIDIVSEACADLLGIKIFNKIYTDPLDQERMIDALIDYRKMTEKISYQEYQIGEALDKFKNGNAGPDYPLEDIVLQTWQMAIGELLQSTKVSQDLKSKMQNLVLAFSYGSPIFQPNKQSSKPTGP